MHQVFSCADVGRVNLVEDCDDGQNKEVDVGSVVGAHHDGTLSRGLQLPDLVDLHFVDHDLGVDTFEDCDHVHAHEPEGVWLEVCHDDPEGVARLLVHILVNLVLVHIQLERILVVG